jgi:hypothetical protein
MYNPFIKKKVKKLSENANRSKKFLNFNEIQTVLILFETKDYEEADTFIERLKQMGKQVMAYAYKDKKDEYDYSETSYKIIEEKQATDWFENNLDDLAEKASLRHYDIVIDLTVRRNPVLEYILLQTKTDMTIGLKKTKKTIYDLAITSLSPSENTDSLKIRELGKQIVHYLQVIHS